MRRILACGHLVVALFLLIPPSASSLAAESAWVKTGVTGRLIYVPDAEGDRIPHFSTVGYGAGQRAIPTDIPVVIHLDPLAGDNTQHIQSAINFAASQPLGVNGFRGVVELGPGKFNVDGRINITSSGVVLRGSGGGDNLAANTHLVSQNRTDSFSSATTPIINIQGSSSGIARGPQIPITDKVVPVGGQSFRVASTAGLAVGRMVEIFRPSTQDWIEALGMHLIPDGKEWSAGDRDLTWQRTITRIEGDRVFIDAPITTALDLQWGGGTIRTFNAPNMIRNVGVENLRGQSLDDREETNENRTPTFVRFTRVVDGWVRDVETRHFTYASVFTSEADGTRHITVDNVNSLLPAGQVTGGRRYSFAMDAPYSLVTNSHADSGRHDFVTGSDVVGPIVFHNSTTSNSRADSGPHHRWGNGLLLDNIDINGNAINVQNRWTSGSGHGWAGANVVVWNSEANSFIMQSPPTAQTWLVGSTGTINAGNCHLGGAACAGYHDSHGTRVTTAGSESLYEAQLRDAADIRDFHWNGGDGNWNDDQGWHEGLVPAVYAVSTRDYVLGDFDGYTYDGRNSIDAPGIDAGWLADIQSVSAAPVVGFDSFSGVQNVGFTINHQLAANERVVHGYLATSLRQSGTPTDGDFVQLFDLSPAHTLDFAALGWDTQINPNIPFVGVIDLGPYLARLQSGSVNVWISDNAAVDWTMYSVTVAAPRADPVGPRVILKGGRVTVDAHVVPIGDLRNGGPDGISELRISATGRLVITQDFEQYADSNLTIEVAGLGAGQFGELVIGGQAHLAGGLGIELLEGYLPAVGDEIKVLTAADGLAGTTFASAIVADLSGQGVWGIRYDPMAVVAQLISATSLGDLDGDGQITASDWAHFKAGQGTDFDGLGVAEIYLLGDLNGDRRHDLTDFWLFRLAYEQANGSGSFVRMLAGVPEPGSATLAATAALAIVAVASARGKSRP